MIGPSQRGEDSLQGFLQGDPFQVDGHLTAQLRIHHDIVFALSGEGQEDVLNV